MPLSKTTINQIEKVVRDEARVYMRRKGYSKIKALNTVISVYEGAIKNPPKWSASKKRQYISEYKKAISIAKRLKKSKSYTL